jgi:hypothetical protein
VVAVWCWYSAAERAKRDTSSLRYSAGPRRAEERVLLGSDFFALAEAGETRAGQPLRMTKANSGGKWRTPTLTSATAKEEAGPSPIRAPRVWAQDDNERQRQRQERQRQRKAEDRPLTPKGRAPAKIKKVTPSRDDTLARHGCGPWRGRGLVLCGSRRFAGKAPREETARLVPGGYFLSFFSGAWTFRTSIWVSIMVFWLAVTSSLFSRSSRGGMASGSPRSPTAKSPQKLTSK